jgi:hypothetical protein
MNLKRSASILVEALVCSMISAVVILGGLSLATLSIKIVNIARETEMKAAGFSSVINEVVTELPGDSGALYGWSVDIRPSVGSPSLPVSWISITGKIRDSTVDVSWKQWEIRVEP